MSGIPVRCMSTMVGSPVIGGQTGTAMWERRHSAGIRDSAGPDECAVNTTTDSAGMIKSGIVPIHFSSII
jgi:hypothetical protein